MNEYLIKVNITKGKITPADGVSIYLVQNDYNSTKFKFEFEKDYSEYTKVFRLIYPDGTTTWEKEITNDEVVLADTNNGELVPVLIQSENYFFEISLYQEDYKLTTTEKCRFFVRRETAGEDVELDDRVPVLNDLIGDANAAINKANNLNISASKTGSVTTVTLTNKSGVQSFIYILDGDIGETGATGNGISNIEKTSTQGLVDTYTITYTNGTTQTFNVTNGADGDDYVITSADYNAIATIVKNDIVIPTKVSDLSNDTGFITNTVNNLANYYVKSQTYTKTEVNNLIGQISTLRLEKVNALPQTGQNGIIYLVPNLSEEENNIFDEYIWIDNDWELIGTTEIDLTGYATETWVTAQISDFLTESEISAAISTALNNYYTKTQVDSALSNKADSSSLTSYVSKTTTIAGVDLQDNITKSEMLTALNVADGAQVNAVASVSVNNTALIPDANKNVNIDMTSYTSDDINTLTTILEEDKVYRGSVSTNTTFTLPTITDNTVLHAIELQVTISNYDSISIDLGATNYFGDIPELGNGNFIIYYEYDGTDWCVGSLSVVGD